MAAGHLRDRRVYKPEFALSSFHLHFLLAHAQQTKKEKGLLMV